MRFYNWQALILLLLLCLILRLVFFVGIGVHDDLGYIHHARALGEGYNILANGGSQLAFRLGMVVPLAGLHALFGFSEPGFEVYPFLSTLLTCTFIYLLAVRLWGGKAGIIAGLLWTVFPLQIAFDTQLSPSNQHATCIVGSLLFFYLGTDRLGNRPVLARIMLVASGTWLGLGWMVNELFVIMAIGGLIFFAVSRPPLKALVWVGFGFLLVFGLDFLIARLASGGWLDRIECISATEAAVTSNIDTGYYWRTLFKLWDVNHLGDEGHFGIMWYLFVLVPPMALIRKNWAGFWISTSVWAILAYMQWGFVALKGDPIPKYIRYLSMLAPLQCLSLGGILASELNGRRRSMLILAGSAAIALHFICSGGQAARMERLRTHDFRKAANLLERQERRITTYADDYTVQFLEIYTGGDLLLRRFRDVPGEMVPTEGYVVVDGSWATVFDVEYRNQLPSWFQHPPPSWKLLGSISNPFSCRCPYDSFDPKIYFIGACGEAESPDGLQPHRSDRRRGAAMALGGTVLLLGLGGFVTLMLLRKNSYGTGRSVHDWAWKNNKNTRKQDEK